MIDARLVAPALAALSAVAVVLLPAQAHASGHDRLRLALTVSTGVVLVTVVVLLVRRTATAAGIVLAALAGCLVASMHAVAIWGGPVAELAEHGRTVTVEAVVQGEPRPVPGRIWQSGPQGLVPLAVSAVTVDDRRIAVSVPVTLACSCGIDDVVVGSHVTVVGRLSPARDIATAAMLRADPDAGVAIELEPGAIDTVTSRMRIGLRTALTGIDPDPAALVAGLSTGDVSLMPPLLADHMKATGLSHLTAVSGANVAIVVACALGLSALVGLRMRLRVPIALLAVLAFVLLVRPEPSVVRAAVMGGIVIVGLLSGGGRAGPAVLAAAVLLLALLAPALALSWAFALSATATLGILIGAPRIPAWLPARTPSAIAVGLGITIAAQIATLPVLLLMGASVSWVSIPANLLAEVAVAPVTILGLLAAVLSPVAAPVAGLLAHVAAVPARFIVAVAGWAERLPGAQQTWPGGIAGIALLACCLLALVLLRVRLGDRRWRRPAALGMALVLALVLLGRPGSRSWPPPDWVMVACDVGQGDAVVLRGEGNAVVVVDTGPEAASMATCLRDLGIARISLLVLTHFHADHVGGLAAAYALPVDRVLVSPIDEPAATFRAAETLIAAHAHDSPVQVATPGMRIALPGLAGTVLWPVRRLEAGSVPNNGSIVLSVVAQGVRILLSGDVEREAQAELARGPRPGIDVLKAPHHGSANLDADFVRWAQAPVTLISVGAGNDYGHPAPAALEAWSAGVLGRTDTDGALAVVRRESGLALVRRG